MHRGQPDAAFAGAVIGKGLLGKVTWGAVHRVVAVELLLLASEFHGFGRVDFNVAQALREIHATNPEALMFGTDLPSTRAERPYSDSDFGLVIEALGADAAREVFHGNAARFYRSGVGFTGQQQDRVGGD